MHSELGFPAGTPLILKAQTNNPKDPKAIAVLTLKGEQIGLVPKEETWQFAGRLVTIAFVESMGLAKNTDRLGVWVRIFPRMPNIETG